MPSARMQITPEQGQFMSMLVMDVECEGRTIEVGVFTGYSSHRGGSKLFPRTESWSHAT